MAAWATIRLEIEIGGTPRQPNAVNLPTPAPTHIPSRVVINEVLIRPHYDWEGTGGVSPDDEFIELYNAGDLPVHLKGWMLDDAEGAGSKPFVIADTVLQAHAFLAFFRSRTHVALNDTGDTVRLLEPGGRVVDRIAYLKVRASNLSYGRLPDGGHHLFYGLWPTAGMPNVVFIQPTLPSADRGQLRLPCRTPASAARTAAPPPPGAAPRFHSTSDLPLTRSCLFSHAFHAGGVD